MSTPITRGIAFASYPCRCLWRGLLQITYTVPLRRTNLQFSQIRLTLDRTFIIALPAQHLGRILMFIQELFNLWLGNFLGKCRRLANLR
jgi:hypothetical protein